MTRSEIINIFKETGALLEGHFILTSGKHSSSYFQCSRVLQHPKYLTFFAEMIAKHFKEEKIDKVISPAIGGVVLGTEVGRIFNTQTIFAERKDGDMSIRRGFEIKPNENILIVEDVITTGGSVNEVIDQVQKYKGNIVGIAVIVDRSNGKVKLHKNQFSIVALEAITYNQDDIPESLSSIPAEKPGSREII